MRQNLDKYEHLKTRHGNMFQETCSLRDEVTNLRKKHDKELEKLKKQIKELREEGDNDKLTIMKMGTEKEKALQRSKELQLKVSKIQEEADKNLDLLNKLQGKYSLQKDLNLMYRRFYSRNVLDQLKKDEFELSLD